MTISAQPYREPTKPVGTVAELFAGVGGFRVGLSRSGWKTVFSNQWEPSTRAQHASDVYVARFGADGHSNVDIGLVEAIPYPFDLLVGGFPCQDYSVAKSLSSATGLAGKKGVLWWEILRLVNLHKPKFLFLENVDRLLKSPSSQRGRDFAVMITTLGNAGYAVEWRVVNAAEYGFPQRRIRVFIVATRLEVFQRSPIPSNVIFEDGVLGVSLPVEPNSVGVTQIPLSRDPGVVSADFGLGAKRTPFGNAGFFIDGIAYTTTVSAFQTPSKSTLSDVLVPDNEVPPEFWISPQRINEWKFLKGAKAIERTDKASGYKYLYSEGAMAFPDSLARPSRTILTGEGGVSPSRFKHVVKTEKGYRRLIPLELERLSGFPDNWTNPPRLGGVSDTKRAFFVGNALVVGLVEKVGFELAARNIGI